MAVVAVALVLASLPGRFTQPVLLGDAICSYSNVLALALCPVALVLAALSRHRFRLAPIDYALILIAGWYALSATRAVLFSETDPYWTWQAACYMVLPVAFWLAIRLFTQDRPGVASGISTALLAWGALLSAIATLTVVSPEMAFRLFQWDDREVSLFRGRSLVGGPVVTGYVLAPLVPLAVGRAIQPGRGQLVRIALAAVIVLGLLATQSRAAIAGAALGMLPIALGARRRFYSAISLMLAALTVAGLIGYAFRDHDFSRVSATATQGDRYRGDAALAAMEMLAEYPIMGTGPGFIFTRDWSKSERENGYWRFYNGRRILPDAHGLYQTVAAETGVPGLLLLLGFFGLLLANVWVRGEASIRLAASTGCVITVIVCSIGASELLTVPRLTIISWLTLAPLLVVTAADVEEKQRT